MYMLHAYVPVFGVCLTTSSLARMTWASWGTEHDNVSVDGIAYILTLPVTACICQLFIMFYNACSIFFNCSLA